MPAPILSSLQLCQGDAALWNIVLNKSKGDWILETDGVTDVSVTFWFRAHFWLNDFSLIFYLGGCHSIMTTFFFVLDIPSLVK